MAIYVKFEIPKTVNEFIKKLYSYRSSGYPKCIETYEDINYSKIQCNAGKMRSFDDLLEIINTYYPDITSKDLIHELITTIFYNSDDHMLLYPHLEYCRDINKIRFIYNNNYSHIDPFVVPKLGSKYSWGELLNMLDITTWEKFKQYVENNKEPLIEEKLCQEKQC